MTVIVIGGVLAGRATLADHYYVPSESMLPTLRIRDHLLVDKAAFGLRLPATSVYLARWGTPARGNVVILRSPQDGTVLVKRIAAVPGDLVQVQGGRLTINGQSAPVTRCAEQLCELLGSAAHPVALDNSGGPDFGPVQVPPGQYLVLGDNRGNSADGRFFGFVRRDSLYGRAVSVFLREGRPTWRSL